MGGTAAVMIPAPGGPAFEAAGRSSADSAERRPLRPLATVQPIPRLHERARTPQPRPDTGGAAREERGVRGALVPRGTPVRRRDPALARFASAQFLAQALAQDLGAGQAPLARHRDGAALGTQAYRRTGAEPPLYPEQARLFRFAV